MVLDKGVHGKYLLRGEDTLRILLWTPLPIITYQDQRQKPSKTWWSGAKHEFVLAIYPFTADFPKPETYGLAQQLRRAAIWIPMVALPGTDM